MNEFTTDLITKLAQGEDINEVFRHQLELAVNQLLETELTGFLGYERYAREGVNVGDSRNGKYQRSFDTQFGQLNLQIPRDRKGEFEPHTVPAYHRRADALETTVIQLYSKGVTTAEIAELIEKMYGAYYTPATISNITKVVGDQVEAFINRTLAKRYVVVYLDALYMPLRRDTVQKEAIHVAIGIRPDGIKEVLNYAVAPAESAEVWGDLLADIKHQGTEEVLLFVADGLVGLDPVIDKHFPKAKRQRCLVHVARHIMTRVRVDDRKIIMADFSQIHQADDLATAQTRLTDFITKWQPAYKKLMVKLQSYLHLLTFYDFPPAIRRSIYSTNLIESFNKDLRRSLRKKEQFPNEESMDRYLVTRFLDYNQRFDSRCHRGFADCRDTLEAMFI
jgi:transposase-like protein